MWQTTDRRTIEIREEFLKTGPETMTSTGPEGLYRQREQQPTRR
jgi:hypothetical protein